MNKNFYFTIFIFLILLGLTTFLIGLYGYISNKNDLENINILEINVKENKELISTLNTYYHDLSEICMDPDKTDDYYLLCRKRLSWLIERKVTSGELYVQQINETHSDLIFNPSHRTPKRMTNDGILNDDFIVEYCGDFISNYDSDNYIDYRFFSKPLVNLNEAFPSISANDALIIFKAIESNNNNWCNCLLDLDEYYPSSLYLFCEASSRLDYDLGYNYITVTDLNIEDSITFCTSFSNSVFISDVKEKAFFSCISSAGSRLSNPDICLAFSLEKEQDVCAEYILTHLVIDLEDCFASCELTSNLKWKENCINYMNEASLHGDTCHFKLDIERPTISIVDSYENLNLDESYCNSLETLSDIQTCFYYLAIQNKDILLCNKLINLYNLGQCYNEINVEPEICNDLVNIYAYQNCVGN
jgi:hypothetical protein